MRSKSTCLFLATIFLASCAAPAATQTSGVSETSEVLIPTPTQTPAPVIRIVVTPGAPIAELPSSAEIDSPNAALPQWIIGNFDAMGLPADLEPSPLDSNYARVLRRHGLVPVLDDGVVASYTGENGLTYAPILAQISSEDGTVLYASGEIQPGGIMEYVSADGAVKRNLRAGIACTDVCVQVVSYNSEDAGGTYWVQVDPDTGEITAYSPAVTEDKPGRAEWLPVGDKWSSALMGSTALQAGEAYGIDYQRSVDGATNIFFFAAGDKQYQAKDREIFYTPTDKRLWVENESGIFLFDNTTHEWTRMADMGTQMIGVGDEQMIIADEAWHTVESIDGSSGVQIVATQDGQKWVWGQDGWARYEAPSLASPFSPEVIAALEKNGLSVAPEDLCLWEGTPEAVQCLTLNPEAVPELADNLRKFGATIGFLDSWNAREYKPGKYATLAQYEAMLAGQPLQLAKDMPMVWRPKNELQTKGVFRPASEWEVGGVRVGNDALIDTAQVGLEIVDWSEAQEEGGFIRLLGGLQMKQALEPVGGEVVNGHQVYRVVYRLADEFILKDLLDENGDGQDDDGILLPDMTLPVGDNAESWNQLLNWMEYVRRVAEQNPNKSAIDGFSDHIQFSSPALVLDKEIMDKMASGTEFLTPNEK